MSEMAQSATGYVYFIRSGRSLKIGWAVDVYARLKKLRTSSPSRMTFVDCVPGDRRLESRLHTVCAAYRGRGEWFRITPELLDAIRSEIGISDLFERSRPDLRELHEERVRRAFRPRAATTRASA